MYTIYADDTLIYTPDVEELCLYNIVLDMEDNSAGTLKFNMVSSHPSFDSLRELVTMIQVKDNNKVIWKGRIISDNSNTDNIKNVQCEGKLAFLNDSIFPEFNFSGSPELLFQKIIENHNRQVSKKQKFLVGAVTVKDNNDYIVRSSESALKTWKVVKEKCFQSSLGGHLQIRYEAEGDYIDWLEDYQEISRQPISFGENIIDLLIDTSAAETYTAIRPQGATINGKRINIADVNEGKDYIIDEEKAADYGIIYADPEDSIWEDVTLPKNLLAKAKERLTTGIVLRKTIEVRAIDLSLTDEQIEALKVCSYVQVLSHLHGIAAYYLLSKANICIDAPENTQYTLGAVKMALTDANKAQQNNAVEAVVKTIPTTISQLENDKKFVNEKEVIEIIEKSVIEGNSGEDGASAYELAVQAGYTGTLDEWLESLRGEKGDPGSDGEPGKPGAPGKDGASAYELAVQNGFIGTMEEWLESLQGEKGEPGIDGEPGESGAPGAQGLSAYELAVQNGFTGTVEEWLESLRGKQGEPGSDGEPGESGAPGKDGASAYELAAQNGFTGTVEEWLESLRGEQGEPGLGGGEKSEILETLESVQANVLQGKLVDALVIKQVFQSVSDGKKLIALAITGRGIYTSETDTFEKMAKNIGIIQSGGDTGEGAAVKELINISMPIPEGKPQIATVFNGLNLGVAAVVKSCEKVKVEVKEG